MNAPAIRSTALPALVTRLAGHFDMVDVNPQELLDTLKQTAFRTPNGQVPTDAQMTALLVVANQYRLNPWTKEIYAFPAKGGGIVPIVGVDGWANIINSHPQFDGMEFEYDHGDSAPKAPPVSVTCAIYRKDRTRPTKVTEFFDECYRNTDPWNGMKKRMLRHKAMMQCARMAFGYGGIHDPDEGADIAGEKFMGMADVVEPAANGNGAAAATTPASTAPQLPACSAEDFEAKLPTWRGMIANGSKTADRMVAFLRTKYTLTEEQEARIRTGVEKQAAADTTAKAAPAAAADAAPAVTYAQVAGKLEHAAAAKDRQAFEDAADLIGSIADPQHRSEASLLYQRLQPEFEAA